jgi:hypothetical protein
MGGTPRQTQQGWLESAVEPLRRAAANTVNTLGETAYDWLHPATQMTVPDRFETEKYPAYMQQGKTYAEQARTAFDVGAFRGHLGNFAAASLPQKMDRYIGGYRADPTGKFGGSDGLETMPYKLEAPELYAHTRAMARGAQFGVPQLSAREVAALALKEGKSFFGVNPVITPTSVTWYDPTSKQDKALYDKLTKTGLDDRQAGFPIALDNKMRNAKRLEKPWQELWVGSGKSEYGETGKAYAAQYAHFLKAADSPKNAPLVRLIQSAIDAEKPQPATAQRAPAQPSVVDSVLSALGLR